MTTYIAQGRIYNRREHYMHFKVRVPGHNIMQASIAAHTWISGFSCASGTMVIIEAIKEEASEENIRNPDVITEWEDVRNFLNERIT